MSLAGALARVACYHHFLCPVAQLLHHSLAVYEKNQLICLDKSRNGFSALHISCMLTEPRHGRETVRMDTFNGANHCRLTAVICNCK
jgi:hypothetical protein